MGAVLTASFLIQARRARPRKYSTAAKKDDSTFLPRNIAAEIAPTKNSSAVHTRGSGLDRELFDSGPPCQAPQVLHRRQKI